MLSIPDMAIIGALALIFFGPDQLPKVARKAGQVVREVQNTSQAFLREMERAADVEPTQPGSEAPLHGYETPLHGYGEPLTFEPLPPEYIAPQELEHESEHTAAPSETPGAMPAETASAVPGETQGAMPAETPSVTPGVPKSAGAADSG
jgi:sec-independent protein translocase protein TatA